jgi:hypothetical protein
MDIVSTRLMGGLGNIMFQIAAAYSVSLRDKKEMVCDTRDMMIPHKPYTFYTNNIFKKVKFSNDIPNQKYVGESGFQYFPIPKLDGNVKLIGHFQSEKYFIEHRNELLELFEINKTTNTHLLEKYGEILNQDTCSIHVRRGDYVGLPNHHPTQSIDYYKNAVKIIGEDNHYLIFSDDIKWCEENFNFLKHKTFVSGNMDYEDLYLMSMCKNNIIANSTFSWWGAWLNKNENKKVVAPSKWFGVMYSSFNTDDLYCNNWIKI